VHIKELLVIMLAMDLIFSVSLISKFLLPKL